MYIVMTEIATTIYGSSHTYVTSVELKQILDYSVNI